LKLKEKVENKVLKNILLSLYVQGTKKMAKNELKGKKVKGGKMGKKG